MKKIKTEKLQSSEIFYDRGFLTKKEVENALDEAMKKIEKNMVLLGEKFPTPNTVNSNYEIQDNIEWTNGFWTGMLWLGYEYTGNLEMRKLAEKNIDNFLERIEKKIVVDHHDLGFLYIPSCVSAYKLTGNMKARDTAILAAEHLITRYHEKGGFIQAWGEMGAEDDYRLIVDCLLNIPLLYWAYEETGNARFKEVADNHYEATLQNAIRDDASAFHTFYFNPETGEPVKGVTRQGFSDDSSWARGQAWLIYGIPLNSKYRKEKESLPTFKAVTNYFLNRLPEDLICYWDLIFKDEDGHSRDSSSAAIAVCGLNEMNKFLPETDEYKNVYIRASHALLKSLIYNYTNKTEEGICPLIDHSVYSYHHNSGIDEGTIWGDYFYLEALIRFYKDWNLYW